MNFLAKFRASPAFVAMTQRSNFSPSVNVPLERWSHRDIATGWCEHRWRKHQRPYRRRIDADAQTVTFQFSNEVDALAFRLVANNGFRARQAPSAQ